MFKEKVTLIPTSKDQNLERLKRLKVNISGERFDEIISLIDLGIHDAFTYFGQPGNTLPFMFSRDSNNLGYNPIAQVVDVPIQYLKKFEVPLSLDQLYWNPVPLEGYNYPIPYSKAFRNAGRHEVAHHFQNIGHPLAKANLPGYLSQIDYYRANWLQYTICAHEVEARMIADDIAQSLGEDPVSQESERRLMEEYSKDYGKPIGELLGAAGWLSGRKAYLGFSRGINWTIFYGYTGALITAGVLNILKIDPGNELAEILQTLPPDLYADAGSLTASAFELAIKIPLGVGAVAAVLGGTSPTRMKIKNLWDQNIPFRHTNLRVYYPEP